MEHTGKGKGPRSTNWQQHKLFQHIADQSRQHANENDVLRAQLRLMDNGNKRLMMRMKELEHERASIRAGQAVPPWVVSQPRRN